MKKESTIKLTFVRHGQTFHNQLKIIIGQQEGQLTPVGIQQAQKIGKYFQNYSFDHIYVSDLNRTKQTYENIVKMALNLKETPYTNLTLIRQRKSGILQGQPGVMWMQQAKKKRKRFEKVQTRRRVVL